ncbi:MAG: hypothetical protein WA733_03145 [Methylocystis sp.]
MGPHDKQRRGKDEPFYHRRRRELGATEELPPTLAAAVAYEALRDIEPLEHQNWPTCCANVARRSRTCPA